MRIDILTCLPELLVSPFAHSIVKRAQDKGLAEIHVHQLRDKAINKHGQIDDFVFGGGAALAGLAGVIGGNAFVTEPGMAATVGSVIFVVVVVGGMGSLSGAFVASLLIGVIQTFAVGVDSSLIGAASSIGVSVTPQTFGYPLWKLKISQIAPILPYLFLVLILIFRPKGLLGTREG